MSNQEEQQSDLLASTNLQFDDKVMNELDGAGKWARASAIFIVVIVLLCCIALASLSLLEENTFLFNGFSFAYLMGIIVALAGFVLIPVLSLWRFSNSTKLQPGALERGIRNLKIYFVFAGIITLCQAFFKLVELFS